MGFDKSDVRRFSIAFMVLSAMAALGFAFLVYLIVVPTMYGSGHSTKHVTEFSEVSSRFPGIKPSSVVSVDFDYEIWDNGFAPSDYDINGTIVVDDETGKAWAEKYFSGYDSDLEFFRDLLGEQYPGHAERLTFDGKNRVTYSDSTI